YPAATFFRANQLAFPVGGTVVVEPGTWFTNNIITNGVNYYFMPGASVVYNTPTTNDAGWGIIDDRSIGATTNLIWGAGVFKFQTYTGLVFSATQGKTANQNFQGVICCSNPATRIHIEGDSLAASVWHNGGWEAAIADEGAAEMYVKFKNIYDPFRGGPSNVMQLISNGNNVAVKSTVNGVVWVTGELYCDIQSNGMSEYGIWGENALAAASEGIRQFTLTNPADLWYRGQYMNCKIYMDNSTTNSTPNTKEWRTWITLDDLEQDGIGVSSAPAEYFGSGKHYLQVKKLLGESLACLNTATVTNDSLQVWLNAQKLTYTNSTLPGSWIRVSGGQVWADVLNFEDLNSTVTNGFLTVTNTSGLGSAQSQLYVTCHAPAVVGSGIGANHQAGVMRLEGITLDTSAGGTSDSPVSVSNTGLVLQNCVLVGPSSAQAISAASAQTVKVYNGLMENITNSPNITINPGSSMVVTNAAVL
ncbi:MAG TPA: hypothetical protein VKV04_04450, partial [Verrucomicrobiae bacterium]|nr:hypothetical protein [Verrucomicrobiae bacterium]